MTREEAWQAHRKLHLRSWTYTEQCVADQAFSAGWEAAYVEQARRVAERMQREQ